MECHNRRMWPEITTQLVNPVVWVELVLTLGLTYAVYRLGRQAIAWLAPHLKQSQVPVLRWIWFLLTAICALAVISVELQLSDLPLLYNLGQAILDGLRHSAGQFLVVIAMALVAWNLVAAVSSRIVPPDAFNRRSVRIETLKNVVDSTLKVAIVVMSLIALLQVVGINALSLLAGVSVLGIAVGFGAQSLVKDLFTGFFILLEGQYGLGDVVTINTGPLTGTVEHLSLRTTGLRASDGTLHIIPNSQINTVSVSTRDWAGVIADVEVANTANLDQALRVLDAVGNEIYQDSQWKPYFMEAPQVQGVTSLGADSVTIETFFKVLPKSQGEIGREFNRRIKSALEQAGIALPTPQRRMSFEQVPLAVKLFSSTGSSASTDLNPENLST